MLHSNGKDIIVMYKRDTSIIWEEEAKLIRERASMVEAPEPEAIFNAAPVAKNGNNRGAAQRPRINTGL